MVVALGCFVASFAVRPAAGRLLAAGSDGPVAAAPGRRVTLPMPSWLGGAPAPGSMALSFELTDARPRAGQRVLSAGTASSGLQVRLVRMLGPAPSLVVRLAPWPGGPLRAVLVPQVRPGRRYRVRLVLRDVRTFEAEVDGAEVVSLRAPAPEVTTIFRPLVAGAGPAGGAPGGAPAGPAVGGVVLSYRALAEPGSSTAAAALLTAAGLAAMALVFGAVVATAGGGLTAAAGPPRRLLAWCRRHPGRTGAVLVVVGGAVLQVVTPPANAVGPRVGYERLAAARVPGGRVVRELLAPLPELGPGRPSVDERLAFTLELSARLPPGGRPLVTTWVHGTGIAVGVGAHDALYASIRTFAEQGGTFALARTVPLHRPVRVVVTATRSRTVEATVDGQQVFAYTFASPVWGPAPTGLEIGAPGARYTVSALSATTALYGWPSPASSLLLVRVAQGLGFLLVAAGALALAARLAGRLVPASRPSRPLVRVVFGVAAAGIAVNLLVDALHLQTVPSPYTPRNTWLFASDARFSDFLQTFELLHGLHPYGVAAGSYPPLGYFLVGPLEAMSPFAALWSFLALFVGVFAWWCWRSFGGGGRLEAVAVLVVAFATYPVSFALDRANVDLLVLLVLALALAGLDAGRDRLTAALVGLAAAAKVFPGLYAVVLLGRSRGWRRLLLAVGVAVAATLVAFLVLPGSLAGNIDGLRRGLHSVQAVYDNGVQSALDSSTLSSFAQAVGFAVAGAGGAQAVAGWTGRLATPAVVAGAVWLVWYLWRREREPWRAVTLVTVAVVLLPQVSYAYDLVYLFLPLALFVRDAPPGRSQRQVAALFGLLLAPKAYLYLGNTFIDSSVLLEAPLLVALAMAVVVDGRRARRDALGVVDDLLPPASPAGAPAPAPARAGMP
ncbi:MAG: glycosyltransferase 87 family protein [Actinomycetota bacterium]|nr:glycosyltransferase 87 family protein [Actinomycetota bacterium]